MTVGLRDEWGGCETSDALTELLFRARALAAHDRSPEVHGGHLVRAVREALAGSDPSLRAALASVGFPYDAVPEPEQPAPRDDARPGAGPLAQPPVPGAETHALLAGLGAWAGLTGDTRATTLHLLAALVEDCPEAAEFRNAGLTADLVLRAGARHGYGTTGAGEDAAFAPSRARPSEPLTVEPPPDTTKLRRHTPRHVAPRLKQHNTHLLPEHPIRHNTPRGVRQMRRVLVLQPLDELTHWFTVLALVGRALGPGPWWLALCPLLILPRAHQLPPVVWTVVKGAAVLLVPAPLRYAVVLGAGLDLLHTWGWVRLKRVDLARPGLRFSWPARQFWRAWSERALGYGEAGTNR
ncbi:hypothetical protein GCM10010297_39050 [Streptomyces malachitofuscus]|nr:hypothetical protein GCM10010297_39050 [Streptomyces malachitofuscus]